MQHVHVAFLPAIVKHPLRWSSLNHERTIDARSRLVYITQLSINIVPGEKRVIRKLKQEAEQLSELGSVSSHVDRLIGSYICIHTFVSHPKTMAVCVQYCPAWFTRRILINLWSISQACECIAKTARDSRMDLRSKLMHEALNTKIYLRKLHFPLF